MSKFVENLVTYPARWTGAVGTLWGALFVCASQFNWWHWTADQSQAVAGLVAAGLGLVTGLGVHALVTPNTKLPGGAENPLPDPPAFVDPGPEVAPEG